MKYYITKYTCRSALSIWSSRLTASLKCSEHPTIWHLHSPHFPATILKWIQTPSCFEVSIVLACKIEPTHWARGCGNKNDKFQVQKKRKRQVWPSVFFPLIVPGAHCWAAQSFLRSAVTFAGCFLHGVFHCFASRSKALVTMSLQNS